MKAICEVNPASPFFQELEKAIHDAYKRLLRPAIENEVLGIARQAADDEAIHVFRENAEALLLAPPAGRPSPRSYRSGGRGTGDGHGVRGRAPGGRSGDGDV